jgi:hypothetical protein
MQCLLCCAGKRQKAALRHSEKNIPMPALLSKVNGQIMVRFSLIISNILSELLKSLSFYLLYLLILLFKCLMTNLLVVFKIKFIAVYYLINTNWTGLCFVATLTLCFVIINA